MLRNTTLTITFKTLIITSFTAQVLIRNFFNNSTKEKNSNVIKVQAERK